MRSEFELDKVLQRRDVAADNRAAVHKKSWGAGNTEGYARLAVRLDGSLCFWRGHAGFERVFVQPSLRGELAEFVPNIFGGDQFLILEDGVVELPEGLGSLHECAASSDRSRIRPWMNR